MVLTITVDALLIHPDKDCWNRRSYCANIKVRVSPKNYYKHTQNWEAWPSLVYKMVVVCLQVPSISPGSHCSPVYISQGAAVRSWTTWSLHYLDVVQNKISAICNFARLSHLKSLSWLLCRCDAMFLPWSLHLMLVPRLSGGTQQKISHLSILQVATC